MKKLLIAITTIVILASCSGNTERTEMVELQNPILPGYFADPSLVQYNGKFYMYVNGGKIF